MKSGLRDRNNLLKKIAGGVLDRGVSMKSGLRDRNNLADIPNICVAYSVSMKSGLRDRNNSRPENRATQLPAGLNEARS